MDQIFDVEAWSVAERGLRLDLLPVTESVFALSNGHIGLRGNLDEGEPAGVPGTYLNAFYETHPLPYAELAYGYPEDGQTMINVTNGKVFRLLVDDEPFDIRYGELTRHERVLDLREGVLRREVEWVSPAGKGIVVRSTRLVSLVQRAVAAILYEVEPVGEQARVVVQSQLVANEPDSQISDDPRVAAALDAPLVGEYDVHAELSALLVHRTRASGLRMAAGMDHVVEGPEGMVTTSESEADLARVTVSTELLAGECLRITKFLAYGWSSERTLPAVRDQVDAALAAAKRTGWDGLRKAQRDYLDRTWCHADIELDGDPSLQQAVRFAIFQVLQAAVRSERRAMPAKGLTGRGYDGHTFWDAEMYSLPVLMYIAPDAARDALRWRHATSDLARARARELGLEGAAFPWRTIRGQECSGYWPAGTAAFHVNAGIAHAVCRYAAATGDKAFEQGPGLELLVDTARLWRSLGHYDAHGGFRIDGVTGPDEYSALADNNVYTNLMAARNLSAAAEVASHHPKRARELDVHPREIASWRDAAAAVVVPADPELGVTPQSDAFTDQREWDFSATPKAAYPLLLNFPYYLLYSSQVVKQADLVLALYVCGDRFDAEQKARDFEYYERITVRDSSLSASMQAIVAAEVGHLDLAYDYFTESALIDLQDLAQNTRQGLHLGSLAGGWLAVVAGFGGMRDHRALLSFAPRLPPKLTRMSFGLRYRGRRLRVEVRRDTARYDLLDGDPLELEHHGEAFTVTTGLPQTCPIEPLQPRPRPAQPAGREPPAWCPEGQLP
jgi:alpha,alpha-trehalose phosphorylase